MVFAISLTVRPARSGESQRPLIFRAAPGDAPIISGCEKITAWEHAGGRIYSARASLHLDHGTIGNPVAFGT